MAGEERDNLQETRRARDEHPSGRRLFVVAAVVASALAIGFVAGRATAPSGTAEAATPPSDSSSSAVPSSEPTEDAPPEALTLGDSFSTSDGSVTTTPTKYRTNVAEFGLDGDDERFDAMLVKTCVVDAPKGTQLSWFPWSLLDGDSGAYPASTSTWGDFPTPEYPFSTDRTFKNGECAKGWIVFRVPAKVKITGLVYAPESDTSVWELEED